MAVYTKRLLKWDHLDPSLSAWSSGPGGVRNWGGWVGAILSDLLLQLSILEIYQEKLNDLLAPSGAKKERLAIRDASGRVEVTGLTVHAVTSTDDTTRLLEMAAAKR